MHNKLFCADKALNKSQENTMPSSPEEKEFTSYVVDLMQSIGPVNAKAMFGGYGIFLEGLMFGLVADSVLYVKVDKKTENEFKAKGLNNLRIIRKVKNLRCHIIKLPRRQ
jgi:DNA transformation protein